MKFFRNYARTLIPAIFLVLLLALLLSRVFKPNIEPNSLGTIQYEEAVNHIGQVMTVCGQVSEAVYRPQVGGNPVFINFGGNAPNHQFTIVIWGRHHNRFNEMPHILYADTFLCVTGQIEEHRGKPQIVANRKAQFDVAP